MKPRARILLTSVIVLLAALTVGCEVRDVSSPATPADSDADTGPPNLSGAISEIDGDFSDLYEPVKTDVRPQIPPYDLPLSPADVRNWDAVAGDLSADAQSLLRSNGFVVVPHGSHVQFQDFYAALHDEAIPPFVTADTALHLLHVRYAVALDRYEQMSAGPNLIALTRTMQAISQRQYDTLQEPLKEAARRNLAYFAVARQLLEDGVPIPDTVTDEVGAELKLIEQHTGLQVSPIFGYTDDYSQYVPRGHYTRHERQKRYFQAMMWCGRITMLLWGPQQKSGALVSQEVADRHTRQAMLMVAALCEDTTAAKEGLDDPPTLAVNRTPSGIWQDMYKKTALFVGLADDLQPSDYAKALRNILGTTFTWSQLASDEMLAKLRERLEHKGRPRIYGSLGGVEIPLPADSEKAGEMLSITQGMRLFGRRFVFDSYITGRLVGGGVGKYTGTGKPFSGRPIRLLPSGLDVMYVLGSERAEEILHELQRDRYENYDAIVATLRGEISELNRDDWRRNLYMGWLDCIREYTGPHGDGYPSFMQTKTWQDRQVHGALASWTQLRHDTILYAKQASYVGMAPPGPQREPFTGYVEPVAELYAKLAALDAMMQTAARETPGREESLRLWSRLQKLAEKELRNERLSNADLEYLADFSDEIASVLGPHEKEWTKSTLVADVFTDGVRGRVLEEGSGYLKMLVAACPRPDGGISLAAGPV
ncbi:MAG: DUF3160 domain-containing protein, partial [Armatimonadota bacterium]